MPVGVVVGETACVAGAAIVVAAIAAAAAVAAEQIANAVAGVRAIAAVVSAAVEWSAIPSQKAVVDPDLLLVRRGDGLTLWNLHRRGWEKRQKR